MSAAPAASNLRGSLLGLAAMALYASHDAIIKALGGVYSPVQIVFFLVLFSFPIVSIYIMQDATMANLRPRHPWWVLLRSLLNTVTSFCAFYAFAHLPLAETYALLFATPLLVTVLAIPLLGERVHIRRWAAVGCGLAGVLIVLRPEGGGTLGLGHLAALTGASASAMSNVIMRKIGGDERAAVLMIYPLMANFLVMGALVWLVYEPMPRLHLAGFVTIAVLSTMGGLLWILSLKTAEATVVAPMQYSQIIWASLFGYLIFDERLTTNVVLGSGVVILSGVYIVLRESRGGGSRHRPVLSTMDVARDRGTKFSVNPHGRAAKAAEDASGRADPPR